jgi:hypothetical protein
MKGLMHRLRFKTCPVQIAYSVIQYPVSFLRGVTYLSSGRSKPATGGHFKTGQSEVRDS